MCLSNIMTGGASLFILRYERLSFEKKIEIFVLSLWVDLSMICQKWLWKSFLSSNSMLMTATKYQANWNIQIERKRIPRQKRKKFVKRRHCVSACISFLLTSLSKQSSWSQDVSAMSNQGRRKVWKSEQVLMKCWTVLTGTPVAFKTWCGHQYRVGIICLLWLR